MNYTKEDIDNLGFEIIEKVFKTKLPNLGFNIREPQLEMAEEILEMVKNKNKCLIVEAGVGTGKSFGYLIPLLILQKQNRLGFSIIVSTGTISLQEQLIKDINFLSEKLNLQINAVLAKGKTHFLCLDRISNYYSNKEVPEWTETWSTYSKYGDRAELENVVPNIENHWEDINIKNCTFRNCKFYNQCTYIDLREHMRHANNVIVTNHDQLIANAKNIENYRKPIFSEDIKMVVIDEAHNLEEKARNALTESWNKSKIFSTLSTVDNLLRKSVDYESAKKRKQKIESIIEDLFNTIDLHCENLVIESEKSGHEIQKFSIPDLDSALLIELTDEINSYSITLQLAESERDDFENVLESLEDIIVFIKSMYTDNNKIFWAEVTNGRKKRISINSVPKEMNEIIYKYFYQGDKAPTILTSATISQPGEDVFEEYNYLITSLGIDFLKYSQLALSNPKSSPFNYKENALLYIPPNIPLPKDVTNFRAAAVVEIINLIKLTEGRTMILFTSKTDMLFVHSQLKNFNFPWTLLVQQDGSSQDKVKRQFIEDENSILLSTGTFWEGIDIPGPSLSNLIIFKLPFPVPDPILKYKDSLSSDGFSEVYLPEMLLKLRQGLGRLIRKETDKGIATILDSRISLNQNKPYRSAVLTSLPFDSSTEDFQEVESFVKDQLNF